MTTPLRTWWVTFDPITSVIISLAASEPRISTPPKGCHRITVMAATREDARQEARRFITTAKSVP